MNDQEIIENLDFIMSLEFISNQEDQELIENFEDVDLLTNTPPTEKKDKI